MSGVLFVLFAQLVDPIVSFVGLLIGAVASTWPKRLTFVVIATTLMALLVAGISPLGATPESGIMRGVGLLAWAVIGVALRAWRQRRKLRA